MTKTIRFKSKKDGKEFIIRVPETTEDVENDDCNSFAVVLQQKNISRNKKTE